MANPVGKTARSVTESNFGYFVVGFRRTLVTNGRLLKAEVNFPGPPRIGVDPGCNNQPIDTSFGVDKRKVGRPAARLGENPTIGPLQSPDRSPRRTTLNIANCRAIRHWQEPVGLRRTATRLRSTPACVGASKLGYIGSSMWSTTIRSSLKRCTSALLRRQFQPHLLERQILHQTADSSVELLAFLVHNRYLLIHLVTRWR